MEALSKIQETERILHLLEDDTKQLKEKLSEEGSDLSELAETLEAQNKEALVSIKDLVVHVEGLSNENRQLKELEAVVPRTRKALEDEVDGLSTVKKDEENNSLQEKVSKLEERVRAYEDEGVLQGKLLEAESKLAQREEEVSELNKKLMDRENDTSARIELLITQMNELQSSLEKLSLVESQNAELTSKVLDQELVLKQQEDTINSLRGGDSSSQAKSRLERNVDRKMEEMGKQFRKNFEADIRIMKQRILVAEQVQTENKESCMRIKERCEVEHSGLDKKVQYYSNMIASSKGEVTKFFNEANETLAVLESSFNRFGEKEADFSYRVSRVIYEVIVIKNLIKKKSESYDIELKEKVGAIEEKMNKEEEENFRLKKRVEKLEKSAMEKEEAIFKLVEEKKEAIRQLCISIEYYQNRSKGRRRA